MRLINTRTRRLEFSPANSKLPLPKYAILSESHAPGEDKASSYPNLIQNPKSSNNRQNGNREEDHQRLDKPCLLALSHGFEYIWIDTLCIDHKNNADIAKAVKSTWKRLSRASVCFVYLDDVSLLAQFLTSQWFTHTWTLPALLAPPSVVFHNSSWEELGTKSSPSLCPIISRITGIPQSILRGETSLHSTSIAQKMSWAARQKTPSTRPEDRAYSLMGLFGLEDDDNTLKIRYGEGFRRAFTRLQQGIIQKFPDDHTIFAWRLSHSCEAEDGSLLAPSPRCFEASGRIV
ncbi:hypothetical protein QBC35DRAFT_350493, partial [Podospora australis]